MNYDELIQNWHTKASDDDFFSKFVFEYLAFVAFLRKKRFTQSAHDRSAIQNLKQDQHISMAYLNEIRNNPVLRSSWEAIIEELTENGRLGNVSGDGEEVEEIKWWNCSHNSRQDQTQEETNKIKGVIYGLEDWENMIEFLYSIRNNLFHGGKNPDDRRDQLLVEHGYKTLRPLVQILLDA